VGTLLAGLAASFAALVAFAVLLYGMPLSAALATVTGSALVLATLLGHLWARERREARG
jgi:multidrug transporter EmrE-like cation transporter